MTTSEVSVDSGGEHNGSPGRLWSAMFITTSVAILLSVIIALWLPSIRGWNGFAVIGLAIVFACLAAVTGWAGFIIGYRRQVAGWHANAGRLMLVSALPGTYFIIVGVLARVFGE